MRQSVQQPVYFDVGGGLWLLSRIIAARTV